MDEKKTKMDDDKSQSVAAIRVEAGTSISSMILEIQKHRRSHFLKTRSLNWIWNLECLCNIDSDRPATKEGVLVGVKTVLQRKNAALGTPQYQSRKNVPPEKIGVAFVYLGSLRRGR
jgi:hypothetical protein